ncbi:MAG: hypothetical protein PVI86_02530 [Phycisphaerae bacterium]|jgi:hypothetical protein
MSFTHGIVAGLVLGSVAFAQGPERVGADKKGSVLLYSVVEVRWDPTGEEILQDTFIELTNDYPQDVWVQLFYVNGDPPLDAVYDGGSSRLLERAHTGWNNTGVQLLLTASQPTYWSVASGMPAAVSPLSVLDPGDPPGRPAPDPTYGDSRVLRGYLIAFASDKHGHEIRWNHLSGAATIVDYQSISAWSYVPWSFHSHSVAHGMEPVSCLSLNLESGHCLDSELVPGRLDFDGFEYDACPDKLLVNFLAAGQDAPGASVQEPGIPLATSLVLLPCHFDMRQDGEGAVTTKANFDIWNQNEVHFSGTERCITCWDQTLLDIYTTFGIPNHFRVEFLQTDRGKARIQGLGSQVCDTDTRVSEEAALLGMSLKLLQFEQKAGRTGVPMSIQGYESGNLSYDVIEPPEEKRSVR